MKYMMFVATDPEPGNADDAMDIEDWVSDVAGAKRLTGDRLRPTSDATTIRVRSGQTLVTDGPFTESKEWIVGFDILDCESLDEAIEIASKHPVAHSGRIELRPFWPGDEG
jgi:hypothetical protein